MAGGQSLEVVGLRKSFGNVQVLRGVDIQAQPGRILGFLGCNGAGKTTTMRTILGLARPDAGTVRYGGRPIDSHSRRAFGYMPEERGLYPRMQVLSQLIYFGRVAGLGRKHSRQAAWGWLELLGLRAYATAKVEQLSHGNQQRVQLAVALIHRPNVLILDEPFSGLDPVGVTEMGGAIREAALQGATIIFSSHQLDLVESLCADIAILSHGKIALSGALEDLRTEAGIRRVEVWIDDRPFTIPLAGARTVLGERPHQLLTTQTSVRAVLESALRHGNVTRIRVEPPSLSDLFHSVVGPNGES